MNTHTATHPTPTTAATSRHPLVRWLVDNPTGGEHLYRLVLPALVAAAVCALVWNTDLPMVIRCAAAVVFTVLGGLVGLRAHALTVGYRLHRRIRAARTAITVHAGNPTRVADEWDALADAATTHVAGGDR